MRGGRKAAHVHTDCGDDHFGRAPADARDRLQSPDLGLERSGHVTDAGMEYLAGMTALKTLNLSGTKISDAGLKYLAGMKSLERLDLSKTAVRGDGLKHLAGMNALIVLNLAAAPVFWVN